MRRGQLPLSDEFSRPLEFVDIEEQGYSRGFNCIAGLDEVGRGPLAGPVVAAAVVLPRGFTHPEIKDSKLLTADRRETIAPVIREKAVCCGIGVVEVEEIDRINILNASLLAMVKAFHGLKPAPDYLLIDGRETIPPGWFKTGEKGKWILASAKNDHQRRSVVYINRRGVHTREGSAGRNHGRVR